jgi:hypothetical protein
MGAATRSTGSGVDPMPSPEGGTGMRARLRTTMTAIASTAALLFLSSGAGGTEACGTYSGRGCAPESQRVDLAVPTFSNPTTIDNPLFPISDLHSVLLLGHVDGKPFRTETTLLPQTEMIAWRGQQVEVRLSQYMAYLDGQITEVALDRYAQADDGSVWYFGEDVFDYDRGVVTKTEGTWLAGRDGPPAMIMPGDPKPGDVYRAENAPGIVFEEVTVDSVGTTVPGPLGPVSGAALMKELHSDGTVEPKIFAPGYGEFRTSGGGDLEALALAVPTDALPGVPSAELTALTSGAVAVLEAVRIGDWAGATATIDHLQAAWKVVRSSEPQPRSVAALVTTALRSLRTAVRSHEATSAARLATALGQSAVDLELRHRPPFEIDVARFELWTQQLRVDAAAKDRDAVMGAVATLEWVRDRFGPVLGADARVEVDMRLRDLRAASDSGNLPSAADHAARLGARMRHLAPRRPTLA